MYLRGCYTERDCSLILASFKRKPAFEEDALICAIENAALFYKDWENGRPDPSPKHSDTKRQIARLGQTLVKLARDKALAECDRNAKRRVHRGLGLKLIKGIPSLGEM